MAVSKNRRKDGKEKKVTPISSAKKPAKKKGKKPSKLEEAHATAHAAHVLAMEARQEFRRLAGKTDQLLDHMAKTYARNDQVLCDYIDEVEDKVHGMARVLYAYSDLMAQTTENHELRLRKLEGIADLPEEHWAARINEELLVGAANQCRQERIEAEEERRKKQEELAAQEAEENPPPKLHEDDQDLAEQGEGEEDEKDPVPPQLEQMSEKELIEATEKASEKAREGYEDGTQYFGG